MSKLMTESGILFRYWIPMEIGFPVWNADGIIGNSLFHF